MKGRCVCGKETDRRIGQVGTEVFYRCLACSAEANLEDMKGAATLRAERDAARAEVAALKAALSYGGDIPSLTREVLSLRAEVERLKAELANSGCDHINPKRCARCRAEAQLSTLREENQGARLELRKWIEATERLHAELSALRAEIEKAPEMIVRQPGGKGTRWHEAYDEPTHRARLVRIEKLEGRGE